MSRFQIPTSFTETQSTTSLGLSAFHERHRLLEDEHQWLLKQIKRKRTELKNFFNQMRTIATRIFVQATPLHQQLIEFDTKIHELFEEILTTGKLEKKSQEEIIRIYYSLQATGTLSPQFLASKEDEDDSLDDLFSDSSNEGDTETRENFFNNSSNEGDTETGENFFNDSSNEGDTETGENFFNQKTHHFHQFNEEQSFRESSTPSPNSKQLRKIFLKLAALFHPDKVTDAETQMHHTEVMKEVNRAYQEGDIARLLEIEKQHHLQEKLDPNSSNLTEIERLCIRRQKDNQLLKTQYENLKKELRIARKTPEGELVKNYRACQKLGIDAVAEMLFRLEDRVKEIENLHDFVRDFRDNKITFSEFMEGPSDYL